MSRGPSTIEALGLRIAPKPWMEQARCAYGNAQTFLGKQIVDPETDEMLMSVEDYYALFDRFFFAEHDDRGATGTESSFLFEAVRECLRCPVWRDCLRHACIGDVSIPMGVAGATTPWERKVIMRSRGVFLKGLSEEGRIALLERLVYAKALGFVRWSVEADHLRKRLSDLMHVDEPDEGWERALRRSMDLLDEQDAEEIAEEGDLDERIVAYIESGTKSWDALSARDLEELSERPELVSLLMRKESPE